MPPPCGELRSEPGLVAASTSLTTGTQAGPRVSGHSGPHCPSHVTNQLRASESGTVCIDWSRSGVDRQRAVSGGSVKAQGVGPSSGQALAGTLHSRSTLGVSLAA